ncbi:hypothetical protein WMY93_022594 [Mugilogobius chulae]|uniref:Uncharacterized protein n=1 Tax=Mugilogobius chulae TaxID=88201 RepID=A0AAW0NHJ0_9GOBI
MNKIKVHKGLMAPCGPSLGGDPPGDAGPPLDPSVLFITLALSEPLAELQSTQSPSPPSARILTLTHSVYASSSRLEDQEPGLPWQLSPIPISPHGSTLDSAATTFKSHTWVNAGLPFPEQRPEHSAIPV